MRQIEAFAGVGGFGLAAASEGIETAAQIEIDDFCQSILQKRFPYSEKHKDVRTFRANKYRGSVDIVCGGFPCQPFSVAGQRRGADDDRALFDEMFRIFQESGAAWFIGENVAGIESIFQYDSSPPMEYDGSAKGQEGDLYSRSGSGYLFEILEKFEAIGCEVQAFVIPACAVGAGHRRDRIWIIAHAPRTKCQRSGNTWGRWAGYSDESTGVVIDTKSDNGNRDERILLQKNDCKRRYWQKQPPECRKPDTKPATYPMREQNIWIDKIGLSKINARSSKRIDTNANCAGLQKFDLSHIPKRPRFDSGLLAHKWGGQFDSNTSEILRMAYGVPGGVDNRGKRIKAMGNAIYPEVAKRIYQAIKIASNGI